MRGLYQARQKIEGVLNDAGVNMVVGGQEDDFLQQKKNFFPAARVDWGNATISNETVNISMSIVIVDTVEDDFGNEENVLNTTLALASRLVAVLQEATADAGFSLDEDVNADYLFEEGTQNYAGWGLTLPLTMPNQSHNE